MYRRRSTVTLPVGDRAMITLHRRDELHESLLAESINHAFFDVEANVDVMANQALDLSFVSQSTASNAAYLLYPVSP